MDFDLSKYPTLNAFAQSEAFVKFVVGPAGCLDRDTEVLTPTGWVSIAEAPRTILVYDRNGGTAYFDDVEPVSYVCNKPLHRFSTLHTLDMVVSDEHTVWCIDYNNMYKTYPVLAEELARQYNNGEVTPAYIPNLFTYKADNVASYSSEHLRACVMFLAVGQLHERDPNCITITVEKDDEKARVRKLLKELNHMFTWTTPTGEPDRLRFTTTPNKFYHTPAELLSCLSKEQLDVIADEGLHWNTCIVDGVYYIKGTRDYVDFMQFVYTATGTPCVITADGELALMCSLAALHHATYEPYVVPDGMKYCFHTKTGMFVARRNGRVFCTGNSAKTSYLALELFRRACLQEPAEPDKEGKRIRYSKALVGRNTYQVLKSATIQTFENMLGDIMTFKKGSYPPTGHIRGQLEDGTYVHLDVEFVSFDSDDATSKLLGYEPTFAMLDEISEFSEEIVDAVIRRVGRYPSGRKGSPTWVGVIGATNGPRKDHWLYDWYLGKRDDKFREIETHTGRKYFELFMQPPALIEKPDGSWVPNPIAENIPNLPNGYGYYYGMLSGDRAKIAAYVEGKFSDIKVGKVVFPEFNRELHVWHNWEGKLPASMKLYLGFDFGRTPVCVIATATPSGKLIVIDEVMGEDISIDTLCTDHLLPVLREKYPRSIIDGAWGDPAGDVDTQAFDVSPYDVLRGHGIPIENPGSDNKLIPRLEAVKQRLTKLDGRGQPQLVITDNCKMLVEAMASTYIYEQVRGRNDVVRDVPTKSHINWASDLCDGLQYMCLGYNSLVGVSNEDRALQKLPPLKRSKI